MNGNNECAWALHQVVARMARESDQILLEQLGIGLAQYKILTSLHESSKSQQRQIAIELGQTEASVSRQIKLLALDGTLMSVKNPSNLRENRVKLTPKGQRVIEAAEKALSRYYQRVFSGLSSKQALQLSELLSLLKP